MKYRTLPIVTALAALLFTSCSKSETKGKTESGSQMEVISAVYGEYTNFADVSFRVKDLLHLDTGFQVQPGFLQADPFPYYHKALVIVYDVKGQRHIFTAYENETVTAGELLEAAKR